MSNMHAALEEERIDALGKMRRTFSMGNWDETLDAYHRLGNLISVRTGIEVRGDVPSPARADTAKGDRATARELLRPLRGRGLSSLRFYGYLAASFLDDARTAVTSSRW